MVVRRWLNVEVLVRLLQSIEPVVAKGGEGMRQDAILIVLGDAAQLNDAVELLGPLLQQIGT